jgi:hypothetical protein
MAQNLNQNQLLVHFVPFEPVQFPAPNLQQLDWNVIGQALGILAEQAPHVAHVVVCICIYLCPSLGLILL